MDRAIFIKFIVIADIARFRLMKDDFHSWHDFYLQLDDLSRQEIHPLLNLVRPGPAPAVAFSHGSAKSVQGCIFP